MMATSNCNHDEEGQEWKHPRGPRQRKGGGPQNQHHQQENDNWNEPLMQIEYIPPDSENTVFQPSMLLLAGLPGSGKSTFARSIVQAMPYKYARVNQDEMQTRQKCIIAAKKAMSTGLSVIVDRCNFDHAQRQVWYDVAAEYHYPVDCVVFQVPVPLCIERCQQRDNHETVAPAQASRIVNTVHRQWQIPTRKEKKLSLRAYQEIKNSTQFNDALAGFLRQK